jgi:hypothetical protein
MGCVWRRFDPAYPDNMTVHKKEEHEQSVFLEFAKIAKLKIVLDTLKSCPPPEPDIFITEGQSPRYFELGRLSDSYFAKVQLYALNNLGTSVILDTPFMTY